MNASIPRRTFLQGSSAAVGIGLAASALGAEGKAPPSDTVAMGFVGIGPMGSGHLNGFSARPDVYVAGICDVFQHKVDAAVKRFDGRPMGTTDFRRLLDRKEIDAVVIATPPHWHAIIAVRAAQAGKDFYVEKPMTIYVAESQAIVEAARRYGTVTQVGTQIHAGGNYRRVVEIVRSGILGPINAVRTFLVMNQGRGGIGKPADCPPPPGLDWEMWIGPGPMRPYNPALTRGAGAGHCWFMDYSGGWIPGMAPPIIDLPIWALDLPLPSQVACSGGRFVIDDVGDCPDVQEALFRYPGCVMTWMMDLTNSYGFDSQGKGGRARRLGIYFHGEQATLYADYGTLRIVPEDDPNKTLDLPKPSLPPTPGHHQEWLNCIRSRQQPSCNVFYHHRVNMPICLANLSYAIRRSVQFDPKTETISGDDEAAKLLMPVYREPWTLG